jgi:2-hydroxychromene-2-carboxylate isomerase
MPGAAQSLIRDARVRHECSGRYICAAQKPTDRMKSLRKHRTEERYIEVDQNPIGTIVDRPNTIQVYSDYKSLCAFLAKDLIYELEDQFDVRLEWLPYTLDIPSYLGSARLDERGEIIESSRNAHQWRRVRYSYVDCRRQARKRGLVVLGTRKIWDSSLAAIGMLGAKRQGKRQLRAFHDRVFERFWRRELDIEDAEAIASVLSEVHADRTGFRSYLAGAGRIEHDTIRHSAESAGVFGVRCFIVEGELFWGREHLAEIREKLASLLETTLFDQRYRASKNSMYGRYLPRCTAFTETSATERL